MGLFVSVYRSSLSDCTNNGISSTAKALCVVNMDGPFEPDIGHPAAILTKGPMGHPIIRPAVLNGDVWEEAPGWWMNGGNIASTSDSRFGQAIRKLGVDFYGGLHIHDRKE